MSEVPPRVVAPGESVKVVVGFLANTSSLNVETEVNVQSNASVAPLSVPLFAYTGHVDLYELDKGIDFGPVEMGELKEVVVPLGNPNPVPVCVVVLWPGS